MADGGSQADRITAEGGDATLLGGLGRDVISAGSGSVTVAGGGGSDRIRTGAGPNTVTGGAGPDGIATGAGDDRVEARDGRRDRVQCGAGNDSANADSFDLLRGCEMVNGATRRRR